MWSVPILTKDKDGHDVAVLLFDTQGTFDTKTTSAVNAFIFGFSIAVSSFTIYNVKERINEQDLDNLIVFSTFFHSLKQGNFQNLMFLVRDWNDFPKFSYGSNGGNNCIKSILEPSDECQLKRTREVIRTTFEDTYGFLLPRPGDQVIESRTGLTMDQLKPEFIQYVGALCDEMFVNKLLMRNSGDGPWTSNVLLDSFDKMIKAHLDGKTVDPGTFSEANGRRVAHRLSEKSFKSYKESMDKAIIESKIENREYFDESVIKEKEIAFRTETMKNFQKRLEPFGSFPDVHSQLIANMNDWIGNELEKNQRIKMTAEAIKEKKDALARAEKAQKEKEDSEERAKKEKEKMEKENRRLEEELRTREMSQSQFINAVWAQLAINLQNK